MIMFPNNLKRKGKKDFIKAFKIVKGAKMHP